MEEFLHESLEEFFQEEFVDETFMEILVKSLKVAQEEFLGELWRNFSKNS